MNKTYYIYKHTNLVNGKVYIGQTYQDPVKRWGNGINAYQHNKHFVSAIKKYGWDNFSHEILLSGLTKEEMEYWEDYYIEFYDSRNPNKGYNIMKGGLKSPFQELWRDENFKLKISQQQSNLMKERLKNPETRKFLQEISIKNWEDHPERKEEYSKRMHDILTEKWKDAEYREARSQQMRDLWKNIEFRNKMIEQSKINAKNNWNNIEYRKKMCKPVINIETGLKFESASAAERWCGLSHGCVTKAVRGTGRAGRHPESGEILHWRYAEEGGDD